MGALASLGLMLAAPHSLAVTWIGTCGVGLCLASIFPAMISLAQRHMRITGRVTGWFFIGASAGGMTLPWLIGQCFEIAGPHTLMLILLLDLVAATAVLGLLILQADRPPCR
jgi:fucose permease